MNLPDLVQAGGDYSVSRGKNVVLFLVLLIGGLVFVMIRRRSAPATPTLPMTEARSALERIEQEGKRDLRAEGHLQALLSWCRLYAVLTVVSCAAMVFLPPKKAPDPERPPLARGTLAMFAGIALVEAAGVWTGLRALAKGQPKGRWIACAAVSAISLSGGVAATLRILNWSESDVVDLNIMVHGALTFYALAGATFLLSSRAARVFAPEYRAAIPAVETPGLRAAAVLARAKSPFSWLPLILMVAVFIMQLGQRKEG